MESEVIESTTLELRARSDEELLRRLAELVSRSRRVEAELVAHIGEVDQRRLFARFAFPSMFAYCTEALHLSEAEAYRRITVARAARQHPVLLEMLGDGRLHLSGLAVLVPLLTAENRDTLLKRATHRSKRQIEALVAALSPRPDARSAIRELPQREQAAGPATGASALARADDRRLPDGGELVPGRVEGTLDERLAGAAARGLTPRSTAKPAVEPLSPGRYKVQFTASAELRDKIERLTALMRSEVPDGDLGTIVERAITEKIARLEARRFGTTTAPRKSLANTDATPTSRHLPAAVRRAVYERNAGRCAFVDAQGRRCSERHRLEFHHRHPFGMGGDHAPENVGLLCAQHNRYLAELDYGTATLQKHAAGKRRDTRQGQATGHESS